MFELGQYAYGSKAELIRRLKSFLGSNRHGVINSQTRLNQLHCLVRLHPDYERKFGDSKIVGFEVQKNLCGSGASFVAIFENGNKERFSYRSCLDGSIPTTRSKAIEAFRFISRPHMMKFRSTVSLPTHCAISGELIERNEDLEIDHRPEFCVLLDEFCSKYHVDLNILLTRGNGEYLALENSEIAAVFARYHSENAKLRPVHKDQHSQRSVRGVKGL